MKKYILLILVLTFFTLPLFAADDAYTVFVQANQLYKATNYARAIELYKKAESLDFKPGALYYNLGNAYYRAGDLGKAIAAYLKARALLPRDSDVLENLNTARAQTLDKIIPAAPPVALKQFLFFYYKFSVDELLWTTAFFIAAFFIFLSIYAFVPNPQLKKIIRIIAVVSIIIGATAAVKFYRLSKHSDAVVISKEAIIRSGPDKSYAEIFVLHNGTEVKVLEKRAGAAKIKVDSKKGWININNIEII